MEKEKSAGLPPRYAGVKAEAEFPTEKCPGQDIRGFPATEKCPAEFGQDMKCGAQDMRGLEFSQDIRGMPENPRARKAGHRRAHSEILTLPDDISFDSDLGVVSDDTEEDLLSMYLDMDKFNLSHTQSLDASPSTSLKTASDDTSKKAMSAAKLAELALIDPKRAKRIWANRQSAARSKERKMRYIAELERKVQTLQTEATSLSAQLTLLQRDTNGLNAENSELKLRLQTMEQQVHLQDALNEALKEEIQHLKVMTGQIPNYLGYQQQQQHYANMMMQYHHHPSRGGTHRKDDAQNKDS